MHRRIIRVDGHWNARQKAKESKVTFFKASNVVCFAALIGTALVPSAKADEWNNKTVMTFSGPVEIPGVHLTGWGVLPAGTYVFKLLDSQSDRHIVQIFSQDEKTVYATILAIPNYRLKATRKTVITFSERPAGEPEALRAWFYPGKNWGDEFVYPKARAVEIAKLTNTPVLYTEAAVPLEVADGRVDLREGGLHVAAPDCPPRVECCTLRDGCCTVIVRFYKARGRRGPKRVIK